MPARIPRIAPPLAAMALIVIAAAAMADEAPPRLDTQARGRAALRAMDCARCHGRDYTGWTAPSLIAAVRDSPRERFEHFVLEGDITRGMPGYRSQNLVVSELDAMYAFLRGKAEAARPATPAASIIPPGR